MLDYAEHFRRQLIQLHPQHLPLQLSPLNECGVRKFLSTSLKPTLLPYTDLYDLPTCASFVSDFLSYLPLDNPHTLPDLLPSLTTILTCRAGDCLDMATLLTSLLLGAGYTALTVTGTADPPICAADQSRTPCPLTPDPSLEQRKRDEDDARRTADDRARNPYLALVPQAPSHVSTFQQRKAHPPPRPSTPPPPAAQPTPLAHAWVLVLPGRREVAYPLFVEPSTGRVLDARGMGGGGGGGGGEGVGGYRSVEVAFNDENCWVNVQAPGGMAWDFADRRQWLQVMTGWRGGGGVGGVGGGKGKRVGGEGEEEQKSTLSPSKVILHLPASWIGPLTVPPDLHQARFPSGSQAHRVPARRGGPVLAVPAASQRAGAAHRGAVA